MDEKLSFKMLELPFSFILPWGCYFISIAEVAPKDIGALIC